MTKRLNYLIPALLAVAVGLGIWRTSESSPPVDGTIRVSWSCTPGPYLKAKYCFDAGRPCSTHKSQEVCESGENGQQWWLNCDYVNGWQAGGTTGSKNLAEFSCPDTPGSGHCKWDHTGKGACIIASYDANPLVCGQGTSKWIKEDPC